MTRRHASRWLVPFTVLSLAVGCGSDGGSGESDGDGAGPDADGGAQGDGEGGGDESGDGSSGDGSSGDGGSDGSDGPDGPPADGVGLATLPNFDTTDNDTFLDGVAGTHDVVIYRVPEGKESWLGKGTLEIARAGEGFTMDLRDAGGGSVSSVKSEGALNAQLTPGIGQVFVYEANEVDNYLNVFLNPEGFISGAAGGFGEVAFRNNVTAFGATVPSLFRQLAGTYEGIAQPLTCEQPPVTLKLEADGTATLEGTYTLSCEAGMASSTWDGNDDYVAPLAMGAGYEVWLDSAKGGGSQAGGGIKLHISDWAKDGVVTYAVSTGNGSIGAIESNSLVKEGALPTQDQFALRMLEGTTLEVTASGDTETAPWNAGTDSLTIDDAGNLSFAGQSFMYQLATNVEGTTDQKKFRWQVIYETFNLLYVELIFKTDKSLVSGTYGGIGQGGTLAPK